MRTKIASVALAFSFLFEPGWTEPVEAEKLWDEAVRASVAGRFLEAGEALEKAAELFSQSGDQSSAALLLEDALEAYLKAEGDDHSPSHTRALHILKRLAELNWSLGDKAGSVEALLLRTELLIKGGRFQEAEAACTLALERSRGLASEPELSYRAVKEMAMLSELLKRWDQAIVYYLESLAAAASVAPEEIPDMQHTLGALYQLQGRPEPSERFYREAITGFEKSKEWTGWSEASFSLALLLGRENRHREALEVWQVLSEKAEPATRADEAKLRSALALGEMGEYVQAYRLLTDYRESVPEGSPRLRLDTHRVQFLVRSDRQKEAEKLLASDAFPDDSARARTASEAGLRKHSARYFERFIATHTGLERAKIQNRYAVELLHWGDYVGAERVLNSALLSEPATNSKQRAYLESNLAECYLKQGHTERALEHFLAAEESYPADSSPTELATLLNNMSACYHNMGRLSESLSYLERAAGVVGTLPGTPPIKATVSHSLGHILAQLGRYEEALEHYRQALAQNRISGHKLGERSVLFNMGVSRILSGEIEAGYRDLELATHLAQQADDLELEAQVLLFFASRRLSGSWESSLERLENIVDKLSSGSIRSNFLTHKAGFELHHKRYGEAEKLAQQAIALYPSRSRAPEVWTARTLLFAVAEARGDLKEVDELALRLMADLEETIWGLSSYEARSLIRQEGQFMGRYSAVLLENNRLSEAFSVEEKRRSLGLTALTRDLPLSNRQVDPALVKERDSLARLIRQAQGNPESAAAKEIDSLLHSYRGVIDTIERGHLASGLMTKVSSADLLSVQNALKTDEVLVEFITQPHRVGALVVDKRSILHFDLGPREELERAAEAAYRAARRLDSFHQTKKTYQELGDKLLAPVLDAFADSTKLVLVPSDGFYSLPFAALMVKGQWAIDRWEITIASSASSWLVARKTDATGNGLLLACLGDYSGVDGRLTPLPGTDSEAEYLKGLFPRSLLLSGKEFVESAVKEASAGKAAVHLATHGEFDAQEPLLSSLDLSDHRVTAADIFGWELQADLAVLAACETAGYSKENSYLGLTAAFQFAGARNLVASYWPVSDAATSLWMKSFYHGLAQGDSPSRAQRRAHLAVREDYPHPFFWAAFALWGDGLHTASPYSF